MGQRDLNNKSKQYLIDERFIEWMLLPSKDLDRYWNDFIDQYPEELKYIELATKQFKSVKVHAHVTTKRQKRELEQKLKTSIRKHNSKRAIRILSYAAAACLIVFFFTINYMRDKNSLNDYKILAISSDIILDVETALGLDSILLVSGNKVFYFGKNINLQIRENEYIEIRSEDDKIVNIPTNHNQFNKLIVPYGKKSKVVFSDGTVGWINSGSILEFPSTFSGEKREVKLVGEMYIEVNSENNRVFNVHTADYTIKVYGTKFNVSTYNDSPSSVVLVEGSIGLKANFNQELLLSPNERAIFSTNSNSFETQSVDVRLFTSWKEGYLAFDDMPITEVLKQIKRHYNINFSIEDDIIMQEHTCTGTIILSDNLDNVLNTIALISETKYTRDENTIYISTNKQF